MTTTIFSILRVSLLKLNSLYYRAIYGFGIRGAKFGKNVSFHGNVYISCTDGGTIQIGDNVSICAHVRIIAKGGAIIIGNDVHIGDGSIVVSREKIEIGNDTLLGEYVVIRDQNHAYGTRPIRHAGFETAPIIIGDDVWIGAKATVLKNSRIESGAIIGAHSLVNSTIAANTLAFGSPAIVQRSL